MTCFEFCFSFFADCRCFFVQNLIATKYQSDEKNAEELQEEVSQSILKTEGSGEILH